MPRLSDIRGQPVAGFLRRLNQAGRLPHALLLEGLPGTGRRTLARAIAQALVCAAPSAGDACGTCEPCRLAAAQTHPDIVEGPHDDGLGELSVESVREEFAARVYESPLMGPRRAFLLYGVERLGAGAANALLKALEEPPAGAYLILTTASAGGVLATIRSRAQLHRLQPLGADDIARILEQGGVARAQARARADRAGGSHRGLWRELDAMPLEELAALARSGFSSALVARVCDALPDRLEPDQEEQGITLLQEQRRVLRQWLAALAQELRRALRAGPEVALAGRIERLLALGGDLDLNLNPRLVVEALAIDQDRRR